MKRFSHILALLSILALVWGAMGCEKQATPAPTATATARSTAAPTATPAPKPEGEIRIALGDLQGETFDPLMVPNASKLYSSVLFDFLVGATPDGDLSPETGLANKWEHSADYKTWTFYLREGVKFHNGDEVTAEDVKFSLQQLGLSGLRTPYATAIFGNIKETVVEGSYKITVNLKNADFFFDWRMSTMIGNDGTVRPRKYIEANGLDYFRNNPIGSGPYRLAGHAPGSSVKLEAVDNHFAVGVPKYKTITLYLAPETTTRIAMLKNGQADIIDPSREMVGSLQKEGYNIFTSRLNENVFVWTCSHVGTSNPLSDKRVREALWLAINKQAILDNLFAGLGELKGTQYDPRYVLGGVSLPPKPFDPERAKQLLKEAGYPDRFADPLLTVHSYSLPGYPEGPAMLEAIAADWLKVGVQVKILPTDYASWRGGHYARTHGNVVSWNQGAPSKLSGLNMNIWRSTPPGAFALFTNPPQPDYDALLDEQAAARNAEEYTAASTKMFRYFYENSNTLTLFAVKRAYAANQKVKQWDLATYARDDLNLRGLATR